MTSTLLFFDLDGTLILNPFWRVVFPTVSQAIAQAAHSTPEAIFEQLMAEHDQRILEPLADAALTMDWEDIIQTIARRNGVEYHGTAEELVINHAAPPHTATLDAAEQVLPMLRQNGSRRLIVATMGLSKYQLPVLRALGLYDHFDDFLTPDFTGFLKTERGFYRDYHDQPLLRIHIGDRYDHDCYYPKQFGAKSILRLPVPDLAPYSPWERPHLLVNYAAAIGGKLDHFNPLPDAVVVNLAELPLVIDQLEANAS